MKKLVFVACIALCFMSCEKVEFDVNNPDVKKFVQQIKKGTYNVFEKGENYERLWLKMPEFNENHIQSLINFSKDTTHINKFPLNPISSRAPFPDDRNYFILGECLLWIVEGIRIDDKYGSLDPFLIDMSLAGIEKLKGLKGSEILTVGDLYSDWWNNNKGGDWRNQNPLENTSFMWY